MRGAGTGRQSLYGDYRITPAYAGSSPIKTTLFFVNEDHPRVCGEQLATILDIPAEQGSPPRMRGAGVYFLHLTRLQRITPAYAGSSFIPKRGVGQVKDHPRVCGEQVIFAILTDCFTGSPPRMRGAEAAACFCAVLLRITPAYAGSRYAFPIPQLF